MTEFIRSPSDTTTTSDGVSRSYAYFVAVGSDLQRAKAGLEAAGIPYEIKAWQPGIKQVLVPSDADVSAIFA